MGIVNKYVEREGGGCKLIQLCCDVLWYANYWLLCRYAGQLADEGELVTCVIHEISAGGMAEDGSVVIEGDTCFKDWNTSGLCSHATGLQMICLGAGLPPLKQKLVDLILSWQYVDFTKIP